MYTGRWTGEGLDIATAQARVQEFVRNYQQQRDEAPGTESSGMFGNQPRTDWDTGQGLTTGTNTRTDVELMNLEADTDEATRLLRQRLTGIKRARSEAAEDNLAQTRGIRFTGIASTPYKGQRPLTDTLDKRIVRDSVETSVMEILKRRAPARSEARGNRWVERKIEIDFATTAYINVFQGLVVGSNMNAEYEGSKIVPKGLLIKLKFIPSVSKDPGGFTTAPMVAIRIIQTSLPGLQNNVPLSSISGLSFIEAANQESYSIIRQQTVQMQTETLNQVTGSEGRRKLRVFEAYINKGMAPIEVQSGGAITDYTPIAGNIMIMLQKIITSDQPVDNIAVKGWIKTFYQCEEIYKRN